VTKSTKIEQGNDQHDTGIAAGVIVIGSIADFNPEGRAMVDFPENPDNAPLSALTTLALTRLHVGRQVALLFNNGDIRQPVIMGIIHNPLDELLQNFELTPVEKENASPFPDTHSGKHSPADIKRDKDGQVFVDGKHVVIEGAEEVTFKCGKASITLTRSGKILIRGTYLLNRSSGVNRIMGGSVQVN